MDEEIGSYILLQQQRSDVNNRVEFTCSEDIECARTSAIQVSRQEHIKTAVIDNQDRFLSRSLNLDKQEPLKFNAAEERLCNLESHLGILTAPCDKNLFSRIKAVEDKILKIEQQYPQIAAHCFNYGEMEREASRRPGGRVSKPEAKTKIKIRMPATLDSAKVYEMQEKMQDLKKKLSKKDF